MDLIEGKDDYAAYFSRRASAYFTRSPSGIYEYKLSAFGQPIWREPQQVIVDSCADPDRPASIESIKDHQKRAIPALNVWFAENSVEKLSYYLNGQSSAVFRAQFNNNLKSNAVVRIGEEDGFFGANHMRIWCPLGVQPDSMVLLKYGNTLICVAEILPLLGDGLIYNTRNFEEFVDENIFAETPYTVFNNKDAGVMADGTPVYLDADCVKFKTAELADRHAKDQFNPEWQQGIMRIIADNSKKCGLKEPLNWVVEQSPGIFVTKQSVIHPSPFPYRPNQRQVIDVKRFGAGES